MTSLLPLTLQIAEIGLYDRLRPVSGSHVEALALSMAEIGLMTPVEVRLDGKEYFLTSGAHRLAAAASLGWTEIEAVCLSGMTDDDFRLREIDENLMRHDLNPLDRAVSLAERKRIYEAKHPETRNGAQGGRGGAWNENDTVSFSKDAAEKTGLDERTIQRAVSIAEGIPTEVRARIAGTPVAEKQSELLALTKRTPIDQAKIVDAMLRENTPASSVNAAIAEIDGRATEQPLDEKQLAALRQAWNKAPKKVRERFLDGLREAGDLNG